MKNCPVNPKSGTNVRQILHGHLAGFHFLFSLLNPSRDSLFLISAGFCSQIFDPKFDADSVLLQTL